MTAHESGAVAVTKSPQVRRFSDLAVQVLVAPALLGGVTLVAVDGRAGSGKSTFAARLVAALRVEGAHTAVIHTDDLLEGWDSVVSYWPRLRQQVLLPLAAGQSATYVPYDWLSGRWATTSVEVAVPDVLVVEGVSAAGACGSGDTTLGVCVVADRRLRLERGIARDGEALRHQWLCWMEKEDSYFATPDCGDITPGPLRVACEMPQPFDVVVDGAPTVGHDPDREYVLWQRVSGDEAPRRGES